MTGSAFQEAAKNEMRNPFTRSGHQQSSDVGDHASQAPVVRTFARTTVLEKAREVVAALEAYDAECLRVFGGYPRPSGRAGTQELAMFQRIEELRALIALEDAQSHP